MRIRAVFLLFLGQTALLAVEPVANLSLGLNTPVELRLEEPVSSASSSSGERVRFTAAEDVRASGRVVIRRGNFAWGTVIASTPRSRLAKNGRLEIRLDAVCLSDGSRARLRGISEEMRNSPRGVSSEETLFSIPAFPVLLFVQGQDVGLPRGHELTAWTDEPVQIDTSRLSGTPVQACEPPSAVSSGHERIAADEPSVLLVRSTPAGADILVDGKFFGQTPSTLRLPPGDRNVVLRSPGRRMWQRTLALTSGGEASIAATLEAGGEVHASEPWLWPLPLPEPRGKEPLLKSSKE